MIRGYKEQLCIRYPNYNVVLHKQIFGVPLEHVMKHPNNQGHSVPALLMDTVEYLAAQGTVPVFVFLFLESLIPRSTYCGGYFSAFGKSIGA